MKKILLATDFSSGSIRALTHALEIATQFKAQLLVLHVVHDPAEAPGFYTAKKAGKKVLRNMEQAAQQMMDEFVAAHLRKYKSREIVVTPGMPAEQIVRVAKKKGADLIAMGTHGRSGFKRLMIGSIADRVIRTAHCPVMIVHDIEQDDKKKNKEDAGGAEKAQKTAKKAKVKETKGQNKGEEKSNQIAAK